MNPISIPAYVPTEAYRAMIDEIIAAPADSGLCLRSRIVEILGAAGVWPLACLEDRLDEKQRRRASGLKDQGSDMHASHISCAPSI